MLMAFENVNVLGFDSRAASLGMGGFGFDSPAASLGGVFGNSNHVPER